LARQLGAEDGMPMLGGFNSLIRDDNGVIWYARGGAVSYFQDGRFISIGRYGRVRFAPAGADGVWILAGEHLYRCAVNGKPQDQGAYLPENAHADANAVLMDRTGA